MVVPYTPGQGLLDAAYALLGATYGTTLSDAEIELPDGVVDVAPRRLRTLPAGGEAIVVARMIRPTVIGSLTLRGKVLGAPFEQRYPLRLEATTAKGNAFVPRLWAAAKIAELESEPDAGSRRSAVELSSRFHVASRYTSLLVLESAAMIQAFGLSTEQRVALWTGEDSSESTSADGEMALAEKADKDEGVASLDKGLMARDDSVPSSKGGGLGSSAGAIAEARKPAQPKAAAEPPAPEKKRSMSERRSAYGDESSRESGYAPAPPPAASTAPLGASPGSANGRVNDLLLAERPLEEMAGPALMPRPTSPPPPRWGRRMIPMRKVWDRIGRIVSPAPLPGSVSEAAISAAERDAAGSDPRRENLKRLYALYLLGGSVDRAAEVAERWSAKDPLDPDALTARADVAAARGDRDLAIRILGSVVDVRPGDHQAQWRLSRLHRWAGRAELACRHSMAVAQIRSTDANLVAEAVRCARDLGRSDVAGDLTSATDDGTRRAVQALLATPPADPSTLLGDLRLEATWDGGDDLDLSLLPPDGNRVSWLGAPTRAVITARDVQSTTREGLALRGSAPGDYVVEITRPDVAAAGERRTVPFVLEGPSVRVALVKISARSRLVPL